MSRLQVQITCSQPRRGDARRSRAKPWNYRLRCRRDNDPQPPSVASGIRVGTPAVTTQGMNEGDMKQIASLIGRAIKDSDGSQRAAVAAEVAELVKAKPAYPTERG